MGVVTLSFLLESDKGVALLASVTGAPEVLVFLVATGGGVVVLSVAGRFLEVEPLAAADFFLLGAVVGVAEVACSPAAASGFLFLEVAVVLAFLALPATTLVFLVAEPAPFFFFDDEPSPVVLPFLEGAAGDFVSLAPAVAAVFLLANSKAVSDSSRVDAI